MITVRVHGKTNVDRDIEKDFVRRTIVLYTCEKAFRAVRGAVFLTARANRTCKSPLSRGYYIRKGYFRAIRAGHIYANVYVRFVYGCRIDRILLLPSISVVSDVFNVPAALRIRTVITLPNCSFCNFSGFFTGKFFFFFF